MIESDASSAGSPEVGSPNRSPSSPPSAPSPRLWFKRDRSLGCVQRLLDVPELETSSLGKLLAGRLATELRLQPCRCAAQLEPALVHVRGDANRGRLVRDRALAGLADPPGGVGRELEAAAPVELLDGAVQPDHAFLDEIAQRHAVALIALRDRDDEAEVRIDHPLLRRQVTALDALRELDLLRRGEQREAAGVAHQQPERIGRDVRVIGLGLDLGRGDLDAALLELGPQRQRPRPRRGRAPARAPREHSLRSSPAPRSRRVARRQADQRKRSVPSLPFSVVRRRRLFFGGRPAALPITTYWEGVFQRAARHAITAPPGEVSRYYRFVATEVARTSTASAAPTRTRRLTHLLAAPVYSFYTARLRHEVERLPLPAHVAVILDGNRRWASLAGLQEAAEGHRAGADKLDELLDWCVRLGIRQVTVWALSNENLGRSEAELSGLLDVVADKLRSLAELHGRQSVRIRVYGRHEEFPERLRAAISSAEEATAENDGLRLNIALGYSGRDELVDATRALVKRLAADELEPATMAQRITPEAIASTPLHRGRARSRPDHPDERRGSSERVPPLAGSAQRALLHGRLLARVARARLPARAADVPAPHAPVRALEAAQQSV